MNGRDYKPNYAGAYFHVYNRGVNKGLIFLDERDYKNFLYRAKVLLGKETMPKRTRKGGLRLKVLPVNSLKILSYCLMPNHFHFLVKQDAVDSIKNFVHRLCTSYSSYFNKKYGRVGHVFQGIYKSKVILEDSYLTQLTAYIHLNPSRPFEWKYSSIQCYMAETKDSLASPDMFMEMHKLNPKKYKIFLEKNYDINILESADLTFED